MILKMPSKLCVNNGIIFSVRYLTTILIKSAGLTLNDL